MKILSVNLFAALTAFCIVENCFSNENQFDDAFYSWWDIAKHGPGPSALHYINVKSFEKLHRMGPLAVTEIKKKVDRDYFCSAIAAEAVRVLNGEEEWMPADNPTIEENLILTNAVACPKEKTLVELPQWALESARESVVLAPHPRCSRWGSLNIKLFPENANFAQISSRVKIPEKKYLVLSISDTGETSNKIDSIIITKWIDKENRVLRVDNHKLVLGTPGKKWTTRAIDYERPEAASEIILTFKFFATKDQEHVTELSHYIDDIRLCAE